MSNNRERNWCITWNNPPKEKSLELIMAQVTSKYKVNYCILANEVGEKEHTPHIQGFISFVNAIRYESVKALFDDKAYVKEMHKESNRYANEIYCKKQGNYIEYGTPPSKTIERKDDDKEDNQIIKDIIAGKSFIEICLDYPKYIKYHYRDFRALYHDIRQELKDNAHDLEVIRIVKDLLE